MGVGEKRVQSFLCVFERVKRVFVKSMCTCKVRVCEKYVYM
jgi:hypothetical protein